MNPFGFGPLEAGILTVLITAAVVWCWAITNATVTANVKEICATIKYVWDDLKVVLMTLVDSLSEWIGSTRK